MSRYTPSAVDAAAARDRWMNTCSGLTSASQGQSLQQSANHTFYPWMAIAGKAPIIDIFMTMKTSLSILKFVSVFEEIR
jgi:hypothetical protein